MRALLILCLSALSLSLGCGPSGSDAPADVASGAPDSEAAPGARARSDAAVRCRSLVADAEWTLALEPCTQAAKELPEDTGIAEALRQAKARAVDMAGDAAAMAGDAAEAAKAKAMEAGDSLGEAASGARDRLGDAATATGEALGTAATATGDAAAATQEAVEDATDAAVQSARDAADAAIEGAEGEKASDLEPPALEMPK